MKYADARIALFGLHEIGMVLGLRIEHGIMLDENNHRIYAHRYMGTIWRPPSFSSYRPFVCSNRARMRSPVAGLVTLRENAVPDEDETYATLQALETQRLVKRYSQSQCGTVRVFWELAPKARAIRRNVQRPRG